MNVGNLNLKIFSCESNGFLLILREKEDDVPLKIENQKC